MVRMPAPRRRAAVTAPTPSSVSTGMGYSTSCQFSRFSSVTASCFFISLPILANTLQKEMPTETVSPSSSFTVWRMHWAICQLVPNRRWLPVTSK